MNKFVKTISASNSDTLASRAKDLGEEVELELSSFTNNLKKEKAQLKSKINKLSDLAPDNTTSLRPGHADFKPSEWVSELHGAKMELALKEVELKVANEIQKEFFGEGDDKPLIQD